MRVFLPVIGQTVCPASMCPLFAPEGSPWTHEKNVRCPRSEPVDDRRETGCMFWDKGCDGVGAAAGQIEEVYATGKTFQIGPVQRKRDTLAQPKEYDCPKAQSCQWQQQVLPKLCPPRYALSLGVDPRASAW